ncbi:MAG: PepSY-associated TM helix domain-containing protein [Flavisolibacter sp.]
MKIFLRRIHLYLALAAGLVILICCLTGAILVFEKDLQMALNKKRYYVEEGNTKLSPDQLIGKLRQAYPDAKFTGIKIYQVGNRSAEVSVNISPAPKANSTKEISQPRKEATPQRQPGYTIFINPYTGDVLEKYSYRETFFYKVFALHRWLLGGEGSIGKYIVGISTLLFLFILITGLILWWPKTKRIFKQRLKIKWDAGWKRVNHDLHLVFGFYSAIFLFVMAFTGLAWSFEWFNTGIYTITNSPSKNPPPPKSNFGAGAETILFDQALTVAKKQYPDAQFYSITRPKDSADIFSVSSLPGNPVHESATDALYIDQYTGAVAGKLEFKDRSLGARVRSSFKPIHTGSIWGTPSKILAFIVCLLGVTFPITGTVMWINRIRKKNKKVKEEPEEDEEESTEYEVGVTTT